MRNATRWLISSALLALGGCQCLEPVAEGKDDAGRDAGVDAGSRDAGPVADGGLDAGPVPDGGPKFDGGFQQCVTAAQCVGALPQSLCNFGGDAGFSCIDRRCVFECSRGRTCDLDAGSSCLDCAGPPPVTACVVPGCGAATGQGTVENMTTGCQVGFTDVMLVPLGNCQWRVTDATGNKGVVTQLGGGQYVGQFSGMGTCVGTSTFGQVERVLFSCEGCQFLLRI